ncbi:unnamed protein product [Parnassius mnemosyne]|uniref:No apical meristem-associated C-terminal domain-containing protein n=1 Tax=Parnassius mnemosyne TaxID=213953 RepID=A0AAV1M2V2_9NEOP
MENIENNDVGNNNDIAPTLSSPTSSQFIKSTPIWKRRRPIIKENKDKAEVVSTLCGGFKDLNSKKATVEDLKIKMLEEEIKFKRELYQLQLETARKELEIKTEVCNQLKGMCFIYW